jgi:hypothetical protein
VRGRDRRFRDRRNGAAGSVRRIADTLNRSGPGGSHFRITASAVMRVALLKGLDQLESELKGSRRS